MSPTAAMPAAPELATPGRRPGVRAERRARRPKRSRPPNPPPIRPPARRPTTRPEPLGQPDDLVRLQRQAPFRPLHRQRDRGLDRPLTLVAIHRLDEEVGEIPAFELG